MALTKLNPASVIERLPTGSVLQTKQGERTTRFISTSGTTFVDCGVSVNITPKSTSSDILITVQGTLSNESNNGEECRVILFRGSTEIGGGTGGSSTNDFMTTLPTQVWNIYPFSNSFLDSPSTISEITYKIQVASGSANDVALGGRGDTTNSAVPTRITVQEIKG